MSKMAAAVFDDKLRYRSDYPEPIGKSGWARIRVALAGICKTDMEIMKGYMGFTGVLGHEFVGVVDQCSRPDWVGRRVVGEINAACGKCPVCGTGMGRHCPNRVTLGIDRLDGCMAAYCLLPVENLVPVPVDLPDDRAVLIEPLAAACEILEQIHPEKADRVVVLGDGRLGILCAWVMATRSYCVTLVGHHPEKLKLAEWRGIQTSLSPEDFFRKADIVVEATGSGRGMEIAMSLCRPRGTIVLKSTVAGKEEVNLSHVVIHELTIVGSRCGRFGDAIQLLQDFPDMPLDRMITDRFPLSRVEEAFARAMQPDVLKVLLEVDSSETPVS